MKFIALFDVYEIKKRPEFYYRGTVKGSPSQYSAGFGGLATEGI